MSRTKKICLTLSIIVAVISSVWIGFYPIAIIIGIFSIVIGVMILKLANIDIKTLGWLLLQIIFLCTAFGLVYMEEYGLSFIDSVIMSSQCLFNVSIMTVPDEIEILTSFKLIASFQSIIGYFLIVIGVGLMINKSKKNDKKGEEK